MFTALEKRNKDPVGWDPIPVDMRDGGHDLSEDSRSGSTKDPGASAWGREGEGDLWSEGTSEVSLQGEALGAPGRSQESDSRDTSCKYKACCRTYPVYLVKSRVDCYSHSASSAFPTVTSWKGSCLDGEKIGLAGTVFPLSREKL